MNPALEHFVLIILETNNGKESIAGLVLPLWNILRLNGAVANATKLRQGVGMVVGLAQEVWRSFAQGGHADGSVESVLPGSQRSEPTNARNLGKSRRIIYRAKIWIVRARKGEFDLRNRTVRQIDG